MTISSVDVESFPKTFLTLQVYVPESTRSKSFSAKVENVSKVSILNLGYFDNLTPFLDHSKKTGLEPDKRLHCKT